MQFQNNKIKDINIDIKAQEGNITSTEFTTVNDTSCIGAVEDDKGGLKDFFVDLTELVTKHKSSIGINYRNIVNGGFLPQGHAESETELIISAYYNDKVDLLVSQENFVAMVGYQDEIEKDKNTNSRLYIYDKETHEYIGNVILPSTEHVGGASLDSEHNILYVTDANGKVVAYDYDMIISTLRKQGKNGETPTIDLSEKDNNPAIVKLNGDIDIQKLTGKKIRASTCTYHDGSLYVANFSYNGYLVKYDLIYNEDGSITTEGKVITTELPAAVQGISFYTDPETGEEYLITCQSYGEKLLGCGACTCLKRYKITEDGKLEFIGQKELDKGFGQGIYCDENGNITVISEYKNYDVDGININNLTDEWDPELENKYKNGVDMFKNKKQRKKFDNPLAA